MPFYARSEHERSEGMIGLGHFEDRGAAHRALQAHGAGADAAGNKRVIEFVITQNDQDAWRYRERARFDTGEYAHVPWCRENWRYEEPLVYHYAHLSLKHAGLIAYTPSDEFGAADRQVRVKPGKYLEEFAPHLDAETIANYIDGCKRFACDAEFTIARSAEDIVSVYVHGPESCMSHDAEFFRHTEGRHPAEVYGDSDLSVAYLGSLRRPTARCIIWESEKRFTRVYPEGNQPLRHALQNAGYTHGEIDGARVRRIALDNGAYLMPYIDGPSYARRDGKWFVLGSGEFYTQNHGTAEGGITGDMPTDDDDDDDDRYICDACGERADNVDREGRCDACARPVCEHCNERFDGEDHDAYCSECDNERLYCNGCEEDTWDGSNRIGGEYYCDSCANDMRHECGADRCHATWYDEDRDAADVADRVRRKVTHLCDACAAKVQVCDACEAEYPIYDLHCPDCGLVPTAPRCPDTIDLPFPTEEVPANV